MEKFIYIWWIFFLDISNSNSNNFHICWDFMFFTCKPLSAFLTDSILVMGRNKLSNLSDLPNDIQLVNNGIRVTKKQIQTLIFQGFRPALFPSWCYSSIQASWMVGVFSNVIWLLSFSIFQQMLAKFSF